MKIIKDKEYGTSISYAHEFRMAKSPGQGFSFNSDPSGNVTLNSPAAKRNYEFCLKGENDRGEKIINLGIKTRTHDYRLDAVGECACGNEVTLSQFTNTCDKCNTDYNMSGQRLAPREQWGEETGENLSDIYNDYGQDY
jgi:hypothetical protein